MATSINTQLGNTEQTSATPVRSNRNWLLSFVMAPFKDIDQRATEEFLTRHSKQAR